jgi:hypothetical protein
VLKYVILSTDLCDSESVCVCLSHRRKTLFVCLVAKHRVVRIKERSLLKWLKI